MEERQEKVEEKPATYRKKIQYYAFGTFGVILIILFINMVISIASRNEEEPKENAKQKLPALRQIQRKSLMRY